MFGIFYHPRNPFGRAVAEMTVKQDGGRTAPRTPQSAAPSLIVARDGQITLQAGKSGLTDSSR